MPTPHTTIIFPKEGVAKGSEKKGTTKDTKSTKKSFSFPLCRFKAFKLFATLSKVVIWVLALHWTNIGPGTNQCQC